MPVPKRKRSRVRRDKRFANKGIKTKILSTCKTCSAPIATHTVCQECGHYKGTKILKTKQERSEKRSLVLQSKNASKNKKNGANSQDNSQITNSAE